jgi:hypothetical protein
MQVLTSVLDLKTALPKNRSVCITASTRFNGISVVNDHVALYSLNSSYEVSLGIVWDNRYDLAVWRGTFDQSPTVWDQAAAITWFENKGFDYLLIPEVDLVERMFTHTTANQIKAEVNQIFIDEGYDNYLPVWPAGTANDPEYLQTHGQGSFARMVVFRFLFLYTARTGQKFIENANYYTGIHATMAHIFRHCFNKYVGGVATIVPVFRDANGVVFDYETIPYPQDAKDMILELTYCFDQFRDDYDFTALDLNVRSVLNDSPIFRLVSIINHYDPIITQDYIWCVTFMRRGTSVASGNTYRMWEYVDGI